MMSSKCVAPSGSSLGKCATWAFPTLYPCQLMRIEGMDFTSFTRAHLLFRFCLENYSGQKDPVFSKRAFSPLWFLNLKSAKYVSQTQNALNQNYMFDFVHGKYLNVPLLILHCNPWKAVVLGIQHCFLTCLGPPF